MSDPTFQDAIANFERELAMMWNVPQTTSISNFAWQVEQFLTASPLDQAQIASIIAMLHKIRVREEEKEREDAL
jgi:hypothetical protein